MLTIGSPSSSIIVMVFDGSAIVAPPPVGFDRANSNVSGPSLETSSTTVMVNSWLVVPAGKVKVPVPLML